MSKRKPLKPPRKTYKDEGNRKALLITSVAFSVLLILLIALIVFSGV